MRNFSQSGKRIQGLRKARGQTQTEFAKSLGRSQGTISAWEKGRDKPSAFGYFQMALMAWEPKLGLRPDSDWFMGRAGAYASIMLAYGETILKERGTSPLEGEIVRVPCVRKTAQGSEDTGQLLPLPAKLIPNPGSTICLVVGDGVLSSMFLPGDMIVLDSSDNQAADLDPFWNQVLLVDIDTSRKRLVDPRFTWGKWPQGLSMGRLRYKRLRPPEIPRDLIKFIPAEARSTFFFWVATLGPLSDQENAWKPGDEGIYLGHWERFADRVGSIEEVAACEREAERQAPGKIRLEDACRILGRVIGWFRPPQKV